MDIFIDHVRRSIISQPTKRSFTLAKWEEAYKKLTSGTEDAAQLYSAGIWVFNKLEKIRNELRKVLLDIIPKKKSILLPCGDMNRTYNLLSKKTPPTIGGDTIIGEQLIQTKVTKNLLGPDYGPDELLTSELDGARFPLIYIFGLKDKDLAIKTLDDLEVLHRMQMMKLYGQYYEVIENIWENCLWNGLIIDQTGKIDILYLNDEFLGRAQAVAEFREKALQMQLANVAYSIWRAKLGDTIKRKLGEKYIVNIHGSGKKREYELRLEGYNPDKPPATLLFRMLAQEAYFDDLVNLEMPDYSNLTLEHLFRAWEILFSLSESLTKNFPKDDSVYKLKKLSQFAPSINRAKLAKLISKGLEISNELAYSIIKLMTFKSEIKCEIWTHPLIEIDSDTIVPVFSAIMVGNLLRTFEYWLKSSGIKFSEKGYLFEKTIRSSLESELKNNHIIKDYYICPEGILLSCNGKNEQIDIVIRIGNKILIAEAKCIVYPVEPSEYFNYANVVNHAVEQIKRKYQFVLEHLKDFVERKLDNNFIYYGCIEIIPIVIMNRSLFVGFSIDSVPIVDLFILEKYFGDAKWEKYVTFDKAGGKEVGETVMFYETEKEAIENVKHYIFNPPQIDFLKKFVVPIEYPLLPLDKNERKALSLKYEVRFPFPEVNLM